MICIPGIWKEHAVNSTYFKMLDALKEKYSHVDKDAIVIFPSLHIRYIYTDMQVSRPYSLPYSDTKEIWLDFINRIGKKDRSIYLHVPKTELSPERYDPSVLDFLSKYEKDTLVKIR